MRRRRMTWSYSFYWLYSIRPRYLKLYAILTFHFTSQHAGEVYGEKAILATELRELQSRVRSLSDERDGSLAILDEVYLDSYFLYEQAGQFDLELSYFGFESSVCFWSISSPIISWKIPWYKASHAHIFLSSKSDLLWFG